MQSPETTDLTSERILLKCLTYTEVVIISISCGGVPHENEVEKQL